MGKNKRIIEFYGLPGAGKTSVCQVLLDRYKASSKMADLISLYKNESLFFKLTHLPMSSFFHFFWFLVFVPQKCKNTKSVYKEFFYFILLYHYFKYQEKYDYLIVDHGFAQQLGSMLHNMDYDISDNNLKRFSSFVKSIDYLSLVYCQLPEQLALERMRKRGRNSGRIDAVMNNTDIAINLLIKESALFDRLNRMMSGYVIKLDMNYPMKQVEANLLQVLS